MESLRTASVPPSAFRSVIDAWLFTVEDDVEDAPGVGPAAGPAPTVDAVLDQRLGAVRDTTPAFAQALRGYSAALAGGDQATAATSITSARWVRCRGC